MRGFSNDPKAVHFPCPFRRQRLQKKPLPFKKDTHFPYPRGDLWEYYLLKRGDVPEPGDVAATARRWEKEYQDLNHMYVIYDDRELKASIDEDSVLDYLVKQIRLQEDDNDGPGDDEICWAALETAEYVDKDGIPTAPKDMKAARKRPDRKMWEDARLKEEQGLHDRGVFEYLTYDELRDRGVVGGRYGKTIVPMRMLLTAKIKADGSFDRAKARNVVMGHKGFLRKGEHFSAVFSAAPQICAETRRG